MNWLVVLALIPLIWRLAAQFLPAQWTEPYAYWDADSLNDGLARWSNMGYWAVSIHNPTAQKLTLRLGRSHSQKPTKRSPAAFTSLPMRSETTSSLTSPTGREIRSVRFMRYPAAQLISVMHLESNPKHLVAIASLPSDTETAQRRVNQYFIEHTGVPTETTWYTGSGAYRPNKDFDHPLYPMRGFLGETVRGKEVVEPVEEQVVFSDDEQVLEEAQPKSQAPEGPEPYDLVYILDAVYHFPPNLGTFVASVLPSLRKGSGVLAYTDIIAPPSLSKLPGRILANMIATFLRVPASNLSRGPKSLADYKDGLENMGYTNVRVEEWTRHVFPGLAANLKQRGGLWQIAGWLADKASSSGWKYVAVRAERPA